MKPHLTGVALAALLAIGASLPGHAEDAAKPADTAAPVSVPRPSIAPRTAEPPPAATEAAPRRHRRYARHHYRRYAYWEPFPIYLPHFHRHRITWGRIPWFYF